MQTNLSSFITFSASIGFRLLSGLAIYALNVVVARRLEVSEYGSFAFFLSLVTFLVILCRFGLDRNLLREVANQRYFNGSTPLNELGAKFGASCVLVALISIVVVTLLFIFSQLLVASVTAVDSVADFLLFGLVIIPWALIYVHADLLRGYGYVNLGLLLCGISVPSLTIMQVYLFDVSGLSEVIGAFFVSATVTLVCAILFVHFKFKLKRSYFILNRLAMKSLLENSMPIFSGLFVANLQLNVSLFILGLYFSSAEIAIYNIGLKTGLLLGIFLLAINSVYEPRFAAFYSSGKEVALRSSLRSSVLLLSVVAIMIGVPLILYPETFLLLFGERYQGASTILVLVASTQMVNLATGPISSLLIMTNGQLSARNIALISLVTTVLCAFLFIPHYGALGAAIAHCAGILVKSILGVFAVKIVLGVNLATVMFKSY